MEMADDSHGELGYVFQDVATPFFAKTAANLDDQDHLKKTFIKLYLSNDYGVRDAIANHAREFLTPESLTYLHQYYTEKSSSNPEGFQARILCQELAAQLHDPELFEAEAKAVNDHYYQAKIVELAKVYQAAGRHQDLMTRLPEWLPLVTISQRSELERIAVETYAITKQPEKAKSLRSKAFFDDPSEGTLQNLSEFANDSEVKEHVAQAKGQIFSEKTLHISHLGFLQGLGDYLAANEYLLARHEQLDGDLYHGLIAKARAFESKEYPLAASLIWRALADSILARASTKSYPFGAKYLKSLHQLAPSVDSWLNHPSHESYLRQLHADHYRKSSFWKLVPKELSPPPKIK